MTQFCNIKNSKFFDNLRMLLHRLNFTKYLKLYKGKIVIKNLLLTLALLFSVSFSTEIYFGNVDQNAGTAEVLYSTDQEIGGFQFDFIG